MLSPREFRERWFDFDFAEPLVAYPPESLAGIAVPDESLAFLTSAGLPRSAAPFLDFIDPARNIIQTATEQWGLSPDYNRYRVIGSNGSGDPLCLDESADGHVVLLNHDCNFHRVFINSSIPQMAEMLLAYRHLVRETQRRNGEEAYLDGKIPVDLKDWFHHELDRVDSAAISDDSFWSHELLQIQDDAT